MAEQLTTLMTLKEARSSVKRINKHLGDLRHTVEEFHNRQGWVALGYETWQDCVKEEFEISRMQAFRLLQAAQIEREVVVSDVTLCYTEQAIPTAHLLPLAALPAGHRKAPYDAAKAKANAVNKQLTARDIQAEVELHQPRKKAENFNQFMDDGFPSDDAYLGGGFQEDVNEFHCPHCGGIIKGMK